MPVTEYFEELLNVLLDEDRELRPSQVSELSDLTSRQAEAFDAAWAQSGVGRRREIVAMLGRLAEENLELLFGRVNRIVLTDPDPEVRRQAIANLWESEDRRLGEFFVKIAREDPDEDVRRQAVQSLGRFVYLGEVEKISSQLLFEIEETLLDILRQTNSDAMRRAALQSLGYSSRQEVPAHIQSAYDSGEEEELRTGLIAMGRSADPAWLPQIMAVLRHPAPHVRAEAVRAAGELEARRAITELIDLLEDAHPEVRRAAIWALGQVGGNRAREALIDLQEAEEASEFEKEIEEALDYIAFLEGTPDLMLFNFDSEFDE